MPAPAGKEELSMDQLSPASVGRGSDTVTLRAVPAPELVTVMANPIWSPSLTVVFSSVMPLPLRSTLFPYTTLFRSEPSLVVVTLAVLSTGESAAVAEVVPEVMCTVKEDAWARSTGRQDRTQAAMAQEVSVGLMMDELS